MIIWLTLILFYPQDGTDRDWLLGRDNDDPNHTDLNRNFPNLNRIAYTNEKVDKTDNNHLMSEWFQAHKLPDEILSNKAVSGGASLSLC